MYGPRERRWRDQGTRRPEWESPVLNGRASNRTGAVPAWRTELCSDVTSAMYLWHDRSQGCSFSAVDWGATTCQTLPGLPLPCTNRRLLPRSEGATSSGLTSYSLGQGVLLSWLTALPFRVAEFQVPAGASRVLAGALRAADALNLVVEGLECGIHLRIMLSQVASCLVCPHILQGIRAFLSPTQASKGRHVNARARGTWRARGSRISRRTL